MVAAQRRKSILNELEAAGILLVEAASQRLQASPITVRRDFAALVKEGEATRVRGGIVAVKSDQAVELPYSVKHTQHLAEKRRIAGFAAGLVQADQAVILDGGTTTAQIAAYLRNTPRVTIITTNLRALVLLSNATTQTVVVPGGVLRPGMYELSGPEMVQFFQTLHVDYAFIGVDGIDLADGVMSAGIADPPMKRAMLAAAREKIVVADHSKFGHHALTRICHLRDVTRIITDTGLDSDTYTRMTDAGIVVDRA
ncbi:MAG TPA: DeoR/GlpR family DNA-binding transcription regulator [Chloroflexota bacterium]